jgi:hypothetical protein
MFFACIWWLIAFTHGDFEESHMPDNQAEVSKRNIINLNMIINFVSIFLSSHFRVDGSRAFSTFTASHHVFYLASRHNIQLVMEFVRKFNDMRKKNV